MEASTWLLRAVGELVPAAELVMTQHAMQAESRRVAGFFESHDVLLTPTLSGSPPRVGAQRTSWVEERSVGAPHQVQVKGAHASGMRR